MFRVIDLNDTGKTRKLLSECAEKGGVFVCKHPERIAEKCIAYNLPIVNALGYDEFDLVKSDKVYYIDELDNFLLSRLGISIGGYSITVES